MIEGSARSCELGARFGQASRPSGFRVEFSTLGCVIHPGSRRAAPSTVIWSLGAWQLPRSLAAQRTVVVRSDSSVCCYPPRSCDPGGLVTVVSACCCQFLLGLHL